MKSNGDLTDRVLFRAKFCQSGGSSVMSEGEMIADVANHARWILYWERSMIDR